MYSLGFQVSDRDSPWRVWVMANLHCWTWIQVPTPIRIPNPIATLYYAEHVHIAQTQIQIPFKTWILNCNCTHF